jgi:hypothetical protein
VFHSCSKDQDIKHLDIAHVSNASSDEIRWDADGGGGDDDDGDDDGDDFTTLSVCKLYSVK